MIEGDKHNAAKPWIIPFQLFVPAPGLLRDAAENYREATRAHRAQVVEFCAGLGAKSVRLDWVTERVTALRFPACPPAGFTPPDTRGWSTPEPGSELAFEDVFLKEGDVPFAPHLAFNDLIGCPAWFEHVMRQDERHRVFLAEGSHPARVCWYSARGPLCVQALNVAVAQDKARRLGLKPVDDTLSWRFEAQFPDATEVSPELWDMLEKAKDTERALWL